MAIFTSINCENTESSGSSGLFGGGLVVEWAKIEVNHAEFR